MAQSAIFLPQESFFSSCMLETHLSKKPSQATLITSFWRIKSLILSGRLTQEEDLLIISVNNLKTFSVKWLPIIPMKDQKFNKLLHIHGSRVQFVLTAKLKMSSVWDKRSWTLFWIKEENNRKYKSNKIWLLPLQEESVTEEMVMKYKLKSLKTLEPNFI